MEQQEAYPKINEDLRYATMNTTPADAPDADLIEEDSKLTVKHIPVSCCQVEHCCSGKAKKKKRSFLEIIFDRKPKKKKKKPKKPKVEPCAPDCPCRCHKEKTVTQVAIDMALLTANANQLRMLMVMKDLCYKINWEQTRTLENGDVVPTGCDVHQLTWRILFIMVLTSLGLQVLVGAANAMAFAFIQSPNQSPVARLVNTLSVTAMFVVTTVNIVLTGIFSS